jgi:hypothetical protein
MNKSNASKPAPDYIDLFFQSLGGQFRLIPSHLQPPTMLQLQKFITEAMLPPQDQYHYSDENTYSYTIM